MQTVTTKTLAKVAAVATGLAMATSMLSFAPTAYAASLTSSQIQSILSLLSSFGANSATIANVNAALNGTSSTSTTGGTTTTTTSASCSFSAALTIGSTGAAVTCLQQALIANGYSIPAGATGYFGAQTQAAVAAWQKAVGVSPTAGYFGAISQAHWNLGGGSSSTNTTTTTTTTTTGTYTGTGNGLKIMLSATSPNGSVLVQGQGIGDLADFVFANPTGSAINVTGLTFNRIGVSNDSTMTNVYLYNNGTRLTDSAGVSNSQFSFTDPVALFTVPAGQTYTVSVRSDIYGTSTSGQQIGVKLVSATSNGTLDSSVVFPIVGGYQTISAASLATVSYGGTVSPSTTSVSPQNDYPVWQDTVTVSTNPVRLSSMRFTNLGSIDTQYLINLRLYVDGVQAGAAIPSMSSARTVTFDLSSAPVLLSTSSHTIKVLANITGGSSRTIQFSVQRSSDAMFVDSQLMQPVTPTNNGNSFSAITSAGAITINSVGATTGVSVSLDPLSPNQSVAVGASSVEFARFDMLASGENVKVSDLYVYASTTASSGALFGVGGLQNGKIMVNGIQVGSTKNIGSLVANKQDFSLGSSLILPAGQTTVVSIFADAKDTAGTNITTGGSVVVSLMGTTANAQGMASLNSTAVPAANTSGNAISVTSSTLTATKYTGYGSQTVVAGTNNVKLGAFTLSTGSTEGVSVNTIAITTTTANAASITNLTLKNDATGAVLGSVISTPSGGAGTTGTNNNSYAVNLAIPVSSSVTVDIYGNVLSSANNGTMVMYVDTGTAGVGALTGVSSTAAFTTLQTITVGAGTLSVSTGAGDPASNNVVAGASSVMVGEFNFAGSNSAFTVQNLAILIPNGPSTSVTNVTVSYKDINGATQTSTQPLSMTAPTTAPYATATFTGLTMYVPANDSSNLDVYVGTPTVASGATSGAAINVLLDRGGTLGGNSTLRALNGAGSATTYLSTVTPLASGGKFYVRKSIPTFAMQAAPSATPSTGTALYRFSVTADPAGAIEWSHLVFNVSTSTTGGLLPVLTAAYLTDEASGVNLLDSNSTSATTTLNKIYIDLTQNDGSGVTYSQVGAGQTKTYDLFGTINNYTTGTSLSISLAQDGSATSTASAAANSVTMALGVPAGTVENTVWSDRSQPNHSLSTADWTNGYLLKNFTTNATSYSK